MENGVFFDEAYQKSLLAQFCYGTEDPRTGRRLFFENSGGSLRLQEAVRVKAALEAYPDCPERDRGTGLEMAGYVQRGTQDILKTVFGADGGALITELTASQTMFRMVGMILENVSWGTNAVTTLLEHPSAHDAVEYYCARTGREFRQIPANPETGSIDVEEVLRHVDSRTVLVSVMAASNISGNIMPIREIVRRVREINPEIYVLTDCVQHAPHAVIDVEDWGVDGANFAPYKFFSVRGCGYAWVSDRVAALPHPKLTAKEASVQALGTPAPGNFAAMTAVIDYVCSIGRHFSPEKTDRRAAFLAGMQRIHLQERALLHRMLEGTPDYPGLRHIPGVHVYTDLEDLTQKDLIVAMSVDGLSLSACAEEYAKRGITVFERLRSSAYSRRIVDALQIPGEGAIRVSPLHCYGADDIDEYLRVTADISRMAGNF